MINPQFASHYERSLTARFIGTTWDPSGTDRNFAICEWTDQDTIIPCVATIPLKAVLPCELRRSHEIKLCWGNSPRSNLAISQIHKNIMKHRAHTIVSLPNIMMKTKWRNNQMGDGAAEYTQPNILDTRTRESTPNKHVIYSIISGNSA